MESQDLWLTVGRAALVYAFTLFVIRILGKREVGSVTAFDFLVALMLGEVVDEIVFGDVSVTKGFLAIGSIGLLHYINSWASFRSKIVDRVTGAEPTVVVENGQLKRGAMAHERLSEEELESELRMYGIDDLKEVKRATLEPNGQISVIKQDWAKELQKRDINSVLTKA